MHEGFWNLSVRNTHFFGKNNFERFSSKMSWCHLFAGRAWCGSCAAVQALAKLSEDKTSYSMWPSCPERTGILGRALFELTCMAAVVGPAKERVEFGSANFWGAEIVEQLPPAQSQYDWLQTEQSFWEVRVGTTAQLWSQVAAPESHLITFQYSQPGSPRTPLPAGCCSALKHTATTF